MISVTLILKNLKLQQDVYAEHKSLKSLDEKMITLVFVIESEFTGWYGSGLWHELGTIETLVIPGQTSLRAGDVTLLSWREWWEDITKLGWLTLCSPPQVENGSILEDCLCWAGRCELFKEMLVIFFCFTCMELKQPPFPFSIFL